MTSISAATSVKSGHLTSADQKPTDSMRTMLSKSSLAALPPAQLDQELALCVHDAVTAVPTFLLFPTTDSYIELLLHSLPSCCLRPLWAAVLLYFTVSQPTVRV